MRGVAGGGVVGWKKEVGRGERVGGGGDCAGKLRSSEVKLLWVVDFVDLVNLIFRSLAGSGLDYGKMRITKVIKFSLNF